MLAPVPAAGHRTQLPARGWGTQQRVAAPVWENPEWLVAPSFSWAQLLSWLLLPFKEESSGATPLCQICLSSKRISSVMYLTSTILAIPSYNEELETWWDAFSWGHTLRTQRMVLKGGLCPDVSLFLLFFFFFQIYYLRDRQLPSAGSVLQWHSTGLGQTKATNLDLHPAPLLGWLEPSSVAFPAMLAGSWIRSGTKGTRTSAL